MSTHLWDLIFLSQISKAGNDTEASHPCVRIHTHTHTHTHTHVLVIWCTQNKDDKPHSLPLISKYCKFWPYFSEGNFVIPCKFHSDHFLKEIKPGQLHKDRGESRKNHTSISYPLHTQQCVYVNPTLPIHPALPFCLGSIHLFSTSASLFLLCKQVHLYHFSRFHIYALICNICFSDSPHSV